MKIETLAIHGGNLITDSLKPVVQPITLSTTFLHQDNSLIYTRAANPNRNALENLMAKMELGKEAAAFSSGNAAGMAVFQALPHGAHIIAPEDMYHGLRKQLVEVFSEKLIADFVDLTEPENLQSAIREDTKLLWIETPSNPLLNISDIRVLSQIAKKKGILVVCDNTFATPIFQNPLALGADLVMHSSTKYLGGHSDVLGGVLITKELNDFWKKIRTIQVTGGAVPSPMDCYMLTRSIKTLPYRMKGHAENANKMAVYLEQHPKIEKVFYPGLLKHPGHRTAAGQMAGFGGMLSFLFRGNIEQTENFIRSLHFFSNATSLGGVESLIERRAGVEGPDTDTPQNLVRVSVGLENVEDLLEDFESAFQEN